MMAALTGDQPGPEPNGEPFLYAAAAAIRMATGRIDRHYIMAAAWSK